MPRDVRTRWNSTYDMLRFALQYRAAIDDIAGNKLSNLHRYELGDEDWVIVEQLCETLKVSRGYRIYSNNLFRMIQIFKDATLFFSRATPNLATVILAMDHIDEELTMQAQDFNLKPAICAALSMAKKVLNAYYDKTDWSNVYQIAMGMYK